MSLYDRGDTCHLCKHQREDHSPTGECPVPNAAEIFRMRLEEIEANAAAHDEEEPRPRDAALPPQRDADGADPRARGRRARAGREDCPLKVSTAEQSLAVFAQRMQAAARVAAAHANKGDADHLQWVINEMLQHLMGQQTFNAWRREHPGWRKGRRSKNADKEKPSPIRPARAAFLERPLGEG